MRVLKPEVFDKLKTYKPGQKVIYKEKVLIAEKYKPIPAAIYEKHKELFLISGKLPTQCGMCFIDYGDCSGIVSGTCDKFNRKDRININFRFKRNERK